MTPVARRRIALALLLSAGLGSLVAQSTARGFDLDTSLAEMMSGVLEVHITARIIDENDNELVWSLDVTRVTISGRSVSVRMEGNNITIVADFTPYWTDENELLLVAQGQTWVGAGDADDGEYRTSFTTLPIQLGEPIVFFPLGIDQIPVETEEYGRLNIELEINVERYSS